MLIHRVIAAAAGAIAVIGAAAMTGARPGAAGQSEGDAMPLTAEQRAWLDAHPVIRLGPYSNYAPAQFVDEQGRHRGIAAEYVEIVERKLGITFALVYTDTWQEILDKAQAREIDVIAMAADTHDRREYLDFTAPYLDLPAVIIAREGVDQRLKTDDLAGMRVAVVEGYAVHEHLREGYPAIQLEPVPDTRTGLRRVSLGMSEAFVSDLAVASHFIETEGITNLRVVGETDFVYRMGFAVRNDWPELTAMIDQALAQVAPQQSSEIFTRWIRLSHETEFASRRLMWILAFGAGGLALAVAGFVVWNWSLQRRVMRRTMQLKDELGERRRVADALRASEARIRLIINTALDAVITIDAQGLVTGWSRQAEAIFGWPRDEVIGGVLADLIVPRQHRQAHVDGLRRFRETGEGRVINRRIEITAMHRDGHEFPIELAIAPVPAPEGTEFSAFVRDISERKRNEAELIRHRENLEELVAERTAALHEAMTDAESARAQLAERVDELEQALAEVKQLRGLLPICSYCKRIREGEEYVRSVEAYLADHSDARFSHGICPDCYRKHVEPELERL